MLTGTQKDTFDQYGKDLVEARTQAEVQAGIAESSAKNYVIEVLSAELKPMQVGVSALEKVREYRLMFRGLYLCTVDMCVAIE
jgi:hypothetical protein